MIPQDPWAFSRPAEESPAESCYPTDSDWEGGISSELTQGSALVKQKADSRYQLVNSLGHGGMGAVWLAYDRELQRSVALKVLHSWLQGDAAAIDRLRKEVLIASSLSHPNVVNVYDLVDCAGKKALSMEYVEGQTLADRIREDIRLPIVEVIWLGKQICSAIEHAHQRGVVHCDIKPHNILLTADGDARVCDFGLALALDCNRSATPGAHAGSLAYIAPEVALGASPTVRSDIYSLGIVLYQMLTGEVPPLCPDSDHCSSSTRLRISGGSKLFDGSVPDWLARIVVKCTLQRSCDRYADVESVLRDLDKGDVVSRAGSASRSIPKIGWPVSASIVVLLAAGAFGVTRVRTQTQPEPVLVGLGAFTHGAQVPDSQTRARAKGLRDIIHSRLSSLEGLRVVTRPADGFGNRPLGKKPRFVIEGRVASSDATLRAHVRIFDSESNRILGELSADSARPEIGPLVNRVVAWVLARLSVRESSANPTDEGFSSNESALTKYLLASGLMQDDTRNLLLARELLKEAIQLDPRFTRAYAHLGALTGRLYEQSRDSRWLAEAVTFSERAYALDPALPDALHSLADVYRLSGRANQTLTLLRRAVSEFPRSSSFERLGAAYAELGLYDEAIAAHAKAVELDPWNSRMYLRLGAAQLAQASYCDAIASFRTALSLEPESVEAQNNLGGAYLYLGSFEEAVPFLEAALQKRPVAASFSNLGTAHLLAGRSHTAIALFERARTLAPTDPRYVGNLADAHRWANYREEAAALYRRAIELSKAALRNNADNARERARLATHLARLGRTEEALKQIALARAGRHSDAELAYREAAILALSGNVDQALQALERAYRTGITRKYIMHDPDLKSLHSLPRFSAILAIAQPGGDCKI